MGVAGSAHKGNAFEHSAVKSFKQHAQLSFEFSPKFDMIGSMNPKESLAEQKLELMQMLHAIESERVLQLVRRYLADLVAAEPSTNNWTSLDQMALEQAAKDLDAGKGIPWEEFRHRYSQYDA